MEEALAVATLLGGLAALWFFWDKIVFFLRGGLPNSHDVDLYERYKAIFIQNGLAEFYRGHDFLGSFQQSYWQPLARYVDTWHTVEHEFVDKPLNKAHKKVYARAHALASAIATNTVQLGVEGHLRSVRPDYHPPGPTQEHVKEDAREINKLRPAFIRAHNKFVRLANARLHKSAAP